MQVAIALQKAYDELDKAGIVVDFPELEARTGHFRSSSWTIASLYIF